MMSSSIEEVNRQNGEKKDEERDIIDDLIESLSRLPSTSSSKSAAFKSFEDLNLTANENLHSVAIGLVSAGGSDSSRSNSTISDHIEEQLHKMVPEAAEQQLKFAGSSNLYGNSSSSSSSSSNEEKVSSGISSASSSDSSEEDLKTKRKQQQQQQQRNEIDDELRLLRYELKEKDLDIVQLQKEINELQLENKMLKLRTPLGGEVEQFLREDELKSNSSPYLKEIVLLKREKECVVEELAKAQDTIAKLNFEKSTKGIDLYDPNSPDILHKKIRALEKQIHDLEEENEKHINEYCKMEKMMEKLKIDNSDLKQRVNESLLHKEREESLRLENANLKSQLGRIGITNNQLMVENQQLINTFNAKISSFNEGKSVSTQTTVQYLDDDEPVDSSSSSLRVRFHTRQFLMADQQPQYKKTYDSSYYNNADAFNKYTLSQTDDTLIDNFRPFSGSSSDKSTTAADVKKPIYSDYTIYDNRDASRTTSNGLFNSYSYYSKSNGNLNLIGGVGNIGARYQHQHQQHPIYSSSGDEMDEPKPTTNRKSMKINVMRDLKSAQRLKTSALAASKRYSSVNHHHYDHYESPSIDYQSNNKCWTSSKPDHLFESRSSLPPSSSTLRRSQTQTSATLPPRSSLNKLRADHYRMTEQPATVVVPSSSSTTSSTSNSTTTTSEENENVDFSQYKSIESNNNSSSEQEKTIAPINRSIELKEEHNKVKKRPFVPQSVSDIRIGDVVKFSRPGGKISKGVVKYIGPLSDRNETYFGLELDSEDGKHDGVFLNKRYFQTKKNKGVFVSFGKIVMAWG